MKLTTPTYTDGLGSSKTSRISVHMEPQIEKENKSDTDKPLIEYYMVLGCLVVS